MADRRKGPPLFDLMREQSEDPNAHSPLPSPPPASPLPHQRTQPGTHPGKPQSTTIKQTAWDTSGGVSRAERSAAAMLDVEVQSDTGIRLSPSRGYLLLAVALLLIVGAWAIGYNRGEQAGKAEIESYVRDQPVVRHDQTALPAGPSSQSDPTQVNRGPAGSGGTESTTTPATSIARASRGAVMSPSGFLDADPRVVGSNYLVLATLNTEQATDAISFLYSHGVQVIGVPQVDSRAPSANNPSRYTLYSLGVAIPGNRWSAMSTQRIEHQRLIANLGARWQREQRGVSDFSQTNWEKYEP